MYKEREWFRQSHAGFAGSIPLCSEGKEPTLRCAKMDTGTEPSTEQRCAARGMTCSNSLTLEPTAPTKCLLLVSAIQSYIKENIPAYPWHLMSHLVTVAHPSF